MWHYQLSSQGHTSSIQIGLRCDSAVASIYHEGDLEIENCEILFTQEGSYIHNTHMHV